MAPAACGRKEVFDFIRPGVSEILPSAITAEKTKEAIWRLKANKSVLLPISSTQTSGVERRSLVHHHHHHRPLSKRALTRGDSGHYEVSTHQVHGHKVQIKG